MGFRRSCCCSIGADTEELFNALKLARMKRNAMTDKEYKAFKGGRGINRVYIKPISPMFPVPTLGSDQSYDAAITNAYSKLNRAGEPRTERRKKRKRKKKVASTVTKHLTQPTTAHVTLLTTKENIATEGV